MFREERTMLHGAEDNLLEELWQYDPEKFENYLRAIPEIFDKLYK